MNADETPFAEVEPIAVICARRDDPMRRHIEGATPAPCSRCEREVMISPATRRRMGPFDVILCIACMAAIAEERGEKWIDCGRNQDQLDELAANGHVPRRFAVRGDFPSRRELR